MSSRTALIVCRDCAGTGLGEHHDAGYRASCIYCLGQGHLLCYRDKDGNLPDQEREWKSPKLGPVPYNPLRLTNG